MRPSLRCSTRRLKRSTARPFGRVLRYHVGKADLQWRGPCRCRQHQAQRCQRGAQACALKQVADGRSAHHRYARACSPHSTVYMAKSFCPSLVASWDPVVKTRDEPAVIAGMNSKPTDPPFDLELLTRQDSGSGGRGRRATWWLLGLLMMLAVAVVALVLYLQTFEAEEEQRRKTADAQWLEQAARFHFRRLEDDLQVLAHRTRDASRSETLASRDAEQGDIQAGLLLREPGVVQVHGWLAQGADLSASAVGQALQADVARQPVDADMLAVMQDVARELRRPAYGGPLLMAAAKAEGPSRAPRLVGGTCFRSGRVFGQLSGAPVAGRRRESVCPGLVHRQPRGDLDVGNRAGPGTARSVAARPGISGAAWNRSGLACAHHALRLPHRTAHLLSGGTGVPAGHAGCAVCPAP